MILVSAYKMYGLLIIGQSQNILHKWKFRKGTAMELSKTCKGTSGYFLSCKRRVEIFCSFLAFFIMHKFLKAFSWLLKNCNIKWVMKNAKMNRKKWFLSMQKNLAWCCKSYFLQHRKPWLLLRNSSGTTEEPRRNAKKCLGTPRNVDDHKGK